MKGISKYIIGSASDPKGTGVVLTGAAAAITDGNMTEVDLGNQDLDREFALAGRITPNTTAPGATTWLALNWYWSDFKISTPGTNVPLLCPTRKYTTGPIALPNLTLANNGERYFRFRLAESLPTLTITCSTTTATLTFLLGYNPKLNVGDLITVVGGTVTGNGNLMQGTYALATVTTTAGLVTATYTITSSTGTLVGATVYVERTIRRGGNDEPLGDILRPLARYLYVSFDRSALTTNATTEILLGMVRVPGREKLI